MRNILANLDSVATRLETLGRYAEASELDRVSNTLEGLKVAAEQSLPDASYIFPDTHSSVTDGDNHFPINTPGRARNALSRASAFDKAPKWYSGSLSAFKTAVRRAVKARVAKRGKKDSEWDIEVSDD